MSYIRIGIHVSTVDLYAEVQMRSGGNARGAAQSECGSLFYVIAHADKDLRHMQIRGNKAVLMLDLDVIARR